MSQVMAQKTVRLRPLSMIRKELIEQNLEPLKQNVLKKEQAQAAYYNNLDINGIDPSLTNDKAPVHDRLEVIQPNLQPLMQIVPNKEHTQTAYYNIFSSTDHTPLLINDEIPDQDRLEVINQNLQPLKENLSKKKHAQAAYYNKLQSGRSPLLQSFNDRAPVHERLGSSRINRRVPILGTATNYILPKTRNMRNTNKLTRVYTAQSRLNQIRLNQASSYVNMRQNKSIRLRRNIPKLTVHVNNTHSQNVCCRFRLVLNPSHQQDIREIQRMNQRHLIDTFYRVTPVTTQVTLNHRFTHLI